MFSKIAKQLRSDAGFGFIEIMISMTMLAALAVMFLPVLVQGLKQAAVNATLASATQLVNEQVRLAQAAGPVCADVSTLGGVREVTDARDVTIRVTTTVGTCPAGLGTVSVSVTAERMDTEQTLGSASTLVFVT